MNEEKLKEKTRRAYDKIGSDYDNWYWNGAAKKLRADLTRKVLETLRKELTGRPRVLDLCCGTGHLVKGLSEIGNYTGMDFSKSMVRHCSVTYPNKKFFLGDAEKLPFKENSFDAVVCFWSFHHLVYPEKTLDEIKRVLRPGGFVLIATFNDVKVNLVAKAVDLVSTAYWGYTTKRYSEATMRKLMDKRFKSVKLEIFPQGFAVLNAMGIRFLIASGRK